MEKGALMNIQQLLDLASADYLNQMLANFAGAGHPVIHSVQATPAQFPFLVDGAKQNAWFLQITVTFAATAATIPCQLVLKASRNIEGVAERERQFYAHLAKLGYPPQMVRCFGSSWVADDDIGLLLLAQVSGQPIAYNGPTEPHLPQYLSAVRALAGLHATTWQQPGQADAELPCNWTEEFLGAVMPIAKAGAQQLFGLPQQGFDEAQQQRVRYILQKLQSLLRQRAASDGALCINHGDAALWNFVLDERPQIPAYILDFQLWCVNPPAWDLGYMIMLLWPADFRRRFAGLMLATYRDELARLGVIYADEEFHQDLRICILGLVGLLLANLQLGIWQRDVVRPRLHWLLAAVADYNCLDLLETDISEA